METITGTESVTFQDVLDLATWNQPRSLSQLRSFVADHEDALDVEDFDLS